MRIYLTGFMGAGKTYLGSRLAKRLGYPFVDLDAQIEQLTERTVAEIFAEFGEATFRDLEAQSLRSLVTPRIVVATGGGAPCFHDNMSWMNDHGRTVFLDPDVDVLLKRLITGRGHRPLLQSPEALEEIISDKLARRRPTYEQAQIHLKQPASSANDVGAHLSTLLGRLAG